MSEPLVKKHLVDINGIPTTRNVRAASPVKTGRVAGVTAKSATTKKTYASKGPSLKERVDGYADELKNRVAALANDENWNDYLRKMSVFRNYSWNNQILIDIQTGGNATRVAGYKTWAALGRNVKKGEKAIAINAIGTKKVDKFENGAIVKGADGKPEQKEIPIFFGVGVFDIAQTEGEELPESHKKMSSTPPAGLIEDLEGAISSKGFRVEYVDDMHGGALGSTSTDPNNKLVKVLSSLNEAERARTLAHELFHIQAGHLERASEYHTGHGGERNAMEVEADSGGYVLLRMNGMDESLDASAAYVAGWAGVRMGNDKEKFIADSAKNVAQGVAKLSKEYNWRNVQDLNERANS